MIPTSEIASLERLGAIFLVPTALVIVVLIGFRLARRVWSRRTKQTAAAVSMAVVAVSLGLQGVASRLDSGFVLYVLFSIGAVGMAYLIIGWLDMLGEPARARRAEGPPLTAAEKRRSIWIVSTVGVGLAIALALLMWLELR